MTVKKNIKKTDTIISTSIWHARTLLSRIIGSGLYLIVRYRFVLGVTRTKIIGYRYVFGSIRRYNRMPGRTEY